MPKFTISPGVSVQEINQSQYAATTSTTGNVVAMIGYAEKGPFEPTYVYGQQDFVDKFGTTLADVPYLAQSAYKYFDDGNVLLVVRAGDDRDDTEAYPNAAKAASKTIRVNPSQAVAVPGYQTFVTKNDLLAGTFAPSTAYTFSVLADNRAFKTPKYLEKWSAVLDETYNEIGVPSPAAELQDAIIKIACDTQTSASFIVNHKRDISTGSTQEYYGRGMRAGMAHGDAVQATIYRYFQNGTYESVDNDYVTVRGHYGAAVAGTADLKTGFDWQNTNQSFRVTIGSDTYEASLTTETNNIDEVVTAISNALKVAVNVSTTAVTDISDMFNVIAIKPSQTKAYVALILTSDVGGTGFELVNGASSALTTLGWTPKTYLAGDSIHGTWSAQTIEGTTPRAWSGNFVFKKESVTTDAVSFQDPITVSIISPANGIWSRSIIASSIQTALNQAYSSYNYPQSRGIASVDNGGLVRISTTGCNEAFDSIVKISAGSVNDLVSLLGGTNTSVNGTPATSVGEVKITLSAAQKGSYGNKLALKTETQIVKLGATTKTYYNVYVMYNGKVVSSYYKIDWLDPEASNYILTKMSEDTSLSITSVDENDNDALVKLPDGVWTIGDDSLPSGVTADQAEIASFVEGTNGWVESNGAITSMTSDFIQALEKISNPEVYEFHIVAAPGDASPSLQNSVQDFCEARRDCVGVVDAAPYGVGLGIANKTMSITDVNAACSTLNSSYVAAFWPWILDADSDNNQYVWLPPSIYAIKAMTYTDAVADPWYAPAGLTRGKVSALNVEYSAREIDRDVLYGDTGIVNPIVKFVNEGITIWGQKTAERKLSATNRINVRRLLIYAEKLIAKMARSFLFEPNDEANWSAFARQANAILEPIRQRRGLYSFTVICDESTNTDAIVDQNLMVGKIYLQPTKTIEGISVDFTITSTGAVEITES